MNDQEKTENLLDEKPQQPGKPKKKSYMTILIVAALVLICGAGGFYGFHVYRQNQATKNLELGQQYLDDGDYANAVIAFDDVIKINSKDPQAYLLKAQAAVGEDDYDLAQQTLMSLYDVTGDPQYQTMAQEVFYGNSTNNACNGGWLVQKDGKEYYAFNPEFGKSQVYQVANGENTKVYTYESGQGATITNLSLWNNKLYFIDSNGFHSMSLDDNHVSDIDIPGVEPAINNNVNSGSMSLPKIYKGKLYFIKGTPSPGDSFYNFQISVCDLDGSNMKDLVKANGIQNIYNYMLVNDCIYYLLGDDMGVDLKKYDLNTQEDKALTDIGWTYGVGFSRSGDYIFTIKNSSQGSSIARIDTKDDSVDNILNLTNGTIFNLISDDEYIYYIMNDGISRCDFEGENDEGLAKIPEELNSLSTHTEQLTKYLQITDKYLYLECYGHNNAQDRTNIYKYARLDLENPDEGLVEVTGDDFVPTDSAEQDA